MSMRRGGALGALAVALAMLLVILVLLVPAFHGYHLGYNAATDHECLTRLFQWCK